MSDTDTTDIRLFMLKIALSSKFYNINSYNWSDNETRKYIGVIYKRSHGGYDIRSYTTGDNVCLVVNGFNVAEVGKIYKLVNPFGNKDMITDLICLDMTNNIISPIANVLEVTHDEIFIKTNTADIFAVNCYRGW
jgi:hypothetical protein